MEVISRRRTQIDADFFELAADARGQTQTFIQRTRPPCLSESDGGQASLDKNSHCFAKGIDSSAVIKRGGFNLPEGHDNYWADRSSAH